MQYKWKLSCHSFFVICFLCLVSDAIAMSVNNSNICDRLTGTWFGSYTYKNKNDCDTRNGCTQGINLMVTSSGKEKFHVTATNTRGIALEFDISCRNNEVSIPSSIHGALNVSCEETHICVAKYDDEKLFATVMNMKENGE